MPTPVATPTSSVFHQLITNRVRIKTTQLALIVSLFLGAVLTFGTFTDFVLIALFDMFATFVGMVAEGRLDLRELVGCWKQ